MQHSAFLLPLLPDQVQPCREFWQELTGAKSAELAERFKAVGVHRLVASIQTSPIGPALVQYLESEGRIHKAIVKDENSDSELQTWIMAKLREFSGEDYESGAKFPDEVVDVAAEHTSVAGPTKPIIFGLPLLPGQMDAYKSFIAEGTGPRKEAISEYQLSLGMRRVVMTHQSIGDKVYLVQFWETSEDPKTAVGDISNLNTETEKWVLDSYKRLTGEDTTANPPQFEIVCDWKG